MAPALALAPRPTMTGLCLSCMLALASPTWAQNLAPNPGFERATPDGRAVDWGHSAVLTRDAHSGQYAVRLRAAGRRPALFQRAFPGVRSGRLSFWYKTSPKTRHICQTVMLRPSTRTHFDPSPEWRKVETVVTVNRPSQRARPISFTILFTLRHGGSPDSQAWFDDVRIEMLAPEGVAE